MKKNNRSPSPIRHRALPVMPRLSALAIAVGLTWPAADACAALWSNNLEVFVAETLTHDSNVFRVSSEQDPRAVTGFSDRGDSSRSTSVGFNYDLPVSLQRLHLGVTWNDVRYDKFKDLDFTGHDGQASWSWQVADFLSGDIGYTDSTSLASFINFNPGQPRATDLTNTRQAFANAALMVTPRWRLKAGAARLEQRHDAVSRKDNNVNVQGASLGFDYVTPAGNSLGVSAARDEGKFPNRQVLPGSTVDNAYTQDRFGLVGDWTPTGKSHFNARVDRVRRNYQQLSQRDFEGSTFRITYDWKFTGKSSLTAVVMRDISPDEDVQTSFVLEKGIQVRPSIELSEKLKLSGTAQYAERTYRGDPGFVVGSAVSHVDHLRALGATLSYQALRSLSLLLNAQHEKRTSNVRFGDYNANVVNLTLRFSF